MKLNKLSKEVKEEIRDRIVARIIFTASVVLFICSFIGLEYYNAVSFLTIGSAVLSAMGMFVSSVVICGEDD